MLSVRDGVADDIFQEHFQDTPCLLIDQAGDSLYSASSRQSPDGRFGDSLNVVTQHFAMAFRSSFSESFSSFSSSGHADV